MHQIGQDSKNIVLIGLNPILMFFEKYFLDLMNSGFQVPSRNLSGFISINWYIGSFISFVLFGGLIDCIRYVLIKRFRKNNFKNKNPCKNPNFT
jgi:hypothetical protein